MLNLFFSILPIGALKLHKKKLSFNFNISIRESLFLSTAKSYGVLPLESCKPLLAPLCNKRFIILVLSK
jgi:hypothetical protein